METLNEVLVNNHTKLRNIMDEIYEAERKLDRATQAMEMISKDLSYHGYTAKGHRVNPTCQEIFEGYADVSNESTEQSCDNCNIQKKSLDDLAQILLHNYSPTQKASSFKYLYSDKQQDPYYIPQDASSSRLRHFLHH